MKRKFSLYLLSFFICLFLLGACNKTPPIAPTVNDEDLVFFMDKPQNDTPTNFSPSENFAIANGIIRKSGIYRAESIGTVTAGITQHVKTIKKINNKDCFFESVSYSPIIKIAEQKFFNGEKIYCRTGKNISKDCSVKNWNDNIEEIDKDNYKNSYGREPYEISKYIINADTIESEELVSNENGLYTFKFSLKPEASNNIQFEIKTLSDSPDYPVFSYINLTVVMDSNWIIKKIESSEEYKITIKVLGKITCKTHYEETFEDIGNSNLIISEKSTFIK